MREFGYVITDKYHKVYYASEAFAQYLGRPIQAIHFFSLITSPQPDFSKEIILNDMASDGFYNGYVRFHSQDSFWFCDYGKRYDTKGDHIGYEILLHQVNSELTDYMEHFYQNLLQKVNDKSCNSPLDAYIEEKNMTTEMTNTSFSEFMVALQDQYE